MYKTDYTLEDIKILLNESRFEELNYALKIIKDSNTKNMEDIKILDYLSNSSLIAPESREELNALKEEFEKEVVADIESMEVSSDNIATPLVETSEIPESSIAGGVAGAIAGANAAEEAQEELVEETEIVSEYPEVIAEEELTTNISNASFVGNLANKGLTVKDFKSNGEFPHITFEMNNISKPYLDNLMSQLYNNANPGIGYDLTKIGATKEEMFTIYLNDPTIDPEKLVERSQEMIASIEKIVNDTNPEKDYTESMPDTIKNLKTQFTNDAPDVPTNENYRIGYTNTGGTDNFYVMAGSKQDAIKLTEEMGFKPRQYIGAGVVEVNTNGINMNDTKINDASENIDSMQHGQAQVVITQEKAKQKTLGARPNIAAYVDYKSITLVIILIIIVILLVYLMG